MSPGPDALRLAARSLRRSPGVTLTCILALGLGIGATSAIFAFIDKLLLDPFDFSQDGLAMALESSPERERQPVPAALAETWMETATSFSSTAGYEWWEVNLTGVNEPEHLVGYRVSPGFFSTLGVRPMLGRGFTVEEARPGAEDVVVLSEGLWRRRFAADPSILGQRVLLDGVGHTVVGVMPGSFRFPKAAGLWATRRVSPADRETIGSHSVFVVGRLAPGKSLAAAGDELAATSRLFDAAHPHHQRGHRPQVFSLREYGDPTTRMVMWIMAAAVGMILVLACANVANVLLARATVRSREFALRIALGAPRSRIVVQLVAEGVLIALGACVVGLALGEVGIRLLRAGMPANIERFVAGWDRIGLDWRLLGFGVVVSLLAALASTGYAAVEATRQAPAQALNTEDLRSGGGRAGHRRRSLLVLVQVALALVLVNDAGLFIQTLQRILVAPTGFDARKVLTFRVGVAETLAPGDAALRRLLEGALRELVEIPGVEQVGIVSALPLSGRYRATVFEVGGRPVAEGRAPHSVVQVVSGGYLDAMRIPLQQGRSFGPADVPGSVDVALVSEVLAQRHFPGGDALGTRIRVGDRWRTIVGVVGTVRYTEITEPGVAIYLPMAQDPQRDIAVAVRTAGEPLQAAAQVRETLRTALPDQPITDLMPMTQVVSENALLAARYSAGMLGVLGMIALLLSAVGIYGVVSQWVLQRVRELGIRSALGARRSQLVGLVLSRGLTPVALGAALGIFLALGHGRVVRGALFGISPDDPATLVVVLGTVALAATAACLLPARRAARMDPAEVLRGE